MYREIVMIEQIFGFVESNEWGNDKVHVHGVENHSCVSAFWLYLNYKMCLMDITTGQLVPEKRVVFDRDKLFYYDPVDGKNHNLSGPAMTKFILFMRKK